MNYNDMMQIAKRSGVIRWLKSRKIEFLSIRGDDVVAFRVFPFGEHKINKATNYSCVELAPSARLAISDLDWRDGFNGG